MTLNASCSDYFHGTSWNLDGYSTLYVLLLLVLQVLHQVNDYKNTIYKKKLSQGDTLNALFFVEDAA